MNGQIERIWQMERCFLKLQQAWFCVPETIQTDPVLQVCRQTLYDYLASGLWLEDYTSDEMGELPADLQRGVLSQDGLYDLLQAISEWERENQ